MSEWKRMPGKIAYTTHHGINTASWPALVRTMHRGARRSKLTQSPCLHRLSHSTRILVMQRSPNSRYRGRCTGTHRSEYLYMTRHNGCATEYESTNARLNIARSAKSLPSTFANRRSLGRKCRRRYYKNVPTDASPRF